MRGEEYCGRVTGAPMPLRGPARGNLGAWPTARTKDASEAVPWADSDVQEVLRQAASQVRFDGPGACAVQPLGFVGEPGPRFLVAFDQAQLGKPEVTEFRVFEVRDEQLRSSSAPLEGSVEPEGFRCSLAALGAGERLALADASPTVDALALCDRSSGPELQRLPAVACLSL